MALDDSYLDYPQRQYGMDHERYDWSLLSERKSVAWPNKKSLALWINVNLQFFPLDQKGDPFKVPGGMTMPYPDLRHYSLRDYGNRVGLFRILKALDLFGLKSTFTVNTRLAEKTPQLLDVISSRGDEILCHGYHMDAIHHQGMSELEEDELIEKSLSGLRSMTGQSVEGWISPAKNESSNTPDLLAKHGVRYFCDWDNDDMPYAFKTGNGALTAMPLSTEIEDRFVILNNLHSEDSYVDQVCDACDFLLSEAKTQGGRILALNIHPWLMGQPHRIGKLEKILAYLSEQSSIWNASSGEIHKEWFAQQS